MEPPETLLHDERGDARRHPRERTARIARRPAGPLRPDSREDLARAGIPSWEGGPPPARFASRGPGQAQELALGRYRLCEHLGTGGFGEVWRAHDQLLDRVVAVKRIRSGPGTVRARAKREAQACARLAHPAIVALYEAGADEHCYYLISEFVDGTTLTELIAGNALDDEAVVEIGVALADALGHAHDRGVVHRDMKPHNVLIPHAPDARAAAKLTDFGGASLLGEDGLTRTGDVLGTLAYMAPEQSEGRPVGPEADLYALALVLYEALTGSNPVRGATPAATARRIGRRIEPLERHRPDLPLGLTRSLDTALAPGPRERGTLPQLAVALQDALEQGLEPPRARRRRERRERREQRAPRTDGRGPAPEGPGELELPPRAGPTWGPRDHAPATARALEQWHTAHPNPAPGGAGLTGGRTESEPVRPDAAAQGEQRLTLPRGLWIGGAIALCVWQAASGRPGVALLLAAALAPLIALPRRSAGSWLLAALAPALGTLGLAGAFPAVAGQRVRAQSRAGLAALGYWWLALAEPLLGQRLWLGAPAGSPARGVWEGSVSSAAAHVVGPLFSAEVLLGAALWALGAAVLPWIVRGASAALDIVAATAWSAALVAAVPAVQGAAAGHAVHASARGALLGGILGGVVAVAARALRGPV